jgi:nitroreductase
VADVWEVIRSQRACRAYRDDDVDDAVVGRVLEAATFAPSAENRQPWVFIVVRDAESRRAIGELNRRAWAGGGRDYSKGRLSPALFADVEAGVAGGVSSAPVLVVVCGDGSLAHEATLGSSVFPAVQNMLLAASASGLGSALTTLPTVLGDELGDLLGLPDHVHPLAVVPLGWPARRLGPPRRRPPTVFLDRYGKEL